MRNKKDLGIQLSWLEHLTVNQRVVGSSPTIPANLKDTTSIKTRGAVGSWSTR